MQPPFLLGDNMRTEIQLANMALRHISMNKITSLAGTDPSSVLCNDFFDIARDDLYREFPWPFATGQFELTEITSVTLPGWDYIYQHPDDDSSLTLNVATVWSIYNEATATTKEKQNYEIFYEPTLSSKVIATDVDSAYAEVTYIIDDTTFWDAKFDLMFSFKLASLICPALTGDADKALKLMDIYNGLLEETKRISAHEKMKFPTRESPTADSR